MAKLKGIVRLNRGDPRARRNAARLATQFDLSVGGNAIQQDETTGALYLVIAPGEPFSQNPAGLALPLDTNPGLVKNAGKLKLLLADTSLQLASGGVSVLRRTNSGLQVSSGLGVLLQTNSGLTLGSTGLAILLADTSLQLAAGGASVRLATTPGLEVATGLKAKVQGVLTIDASGIKLSIGEALEADGSSNLRVKVKASGGITRDADGLSVDAANLPAATTTTKGAVKQAIAVPDQLALTDSSGGTSGSGTIAAISTDITDPADAPVDADALRDDLVTNTIPSVEQRLAESRDAVATLAAYCISLEDKVNDLMTKLRAAGVLET
jgi:hypothetical protein